MESSVLLHSAAQGIRLTHVSDREGDIYEHMCKIAAMGDDYVVRSSWNRKLANGMRLKASLERSPLRLASI